MYLFSIFITYHCINICFIPNTRNKSSFYMISIIPIKDYCCIKWSNKTSISKGLLPIMWDKKSKRCIGKWGFLVIYPIGRLIYMKKKLPRPKAEDNAQIVMEKDFIFQL